MVEFIVHRVRPISGRHLHSALHIPRVQSFHIQRSALLSAAFGAFQLYIKFARGGRHYRLGAVLIVFVEPATLPQIFLRHALFRGVCFGALAPASASSWLPFWLFVPVSSVPTSPEESAACHSFARLLWFPKVPASHRVVEQYSRPTKQTHTEQPWQKEPLSSSRPLFDYRFPEKYPIAWFKSISPVSPKDHRLVRLLFAGRAQRT